MTSGQLETFNDSDSQVTSLLNESTDKIRQDWLENTKDFFLASAVTIGILGAIGNILVIVTIFRQKNRTILYSLLLQLAISDLIFVFLSPIHIFWMLEPGKWFLGDLGCKLFYFLFRSMYAFSVLILTVLTIERFIAIKFPLKVLQHRKRTVYKYILLIWLISGFLSSPLVFVHEELKVLDRNYCVQNKWPDVETFKAYHFCILIILYLLPLLLMSVLYALIWQKIRGTPILAEATSHRTRALATRKKIAKLSMVLVTAFFMCWSPWSVIECLHMVFVPWQPPKVFFMAAHFSMLPAFASTVLNPICYCFMSNDFRRGLRRLFRRRNQINPPQVHGGVHVKIKPVHTKSTKTTSTFKYNLRSRRYTL